jgi:hypothetical protein
VNTIIYFDAYNINKKKKIYGVLFSLDVPIRMAVLSCSKNYKNILSANMSCINSVTKSAHESTHNRLKTNDFRVQLT